MPPRDRPGGAGVIQVDVREQQVRHRAQRRARPLERVARASAGSWWARDRRSPRPPRPAAAPPRSAWADRGTAGRSTTRPRPAGVPGSSPATDYTGAEPRHAPSGFLGRAGLGGQTRRGDGEPDRCREPSGRGAAVGDPVRRAARAAARPGRVVHELHRRRRRPRGSHRPPHRQHRHAAEPERRRDALEAGLHHPPGRPRARRHLAHVPRGERVQRGGPGHDGRGGRSAGARHRAHRRPRAREPAPRSHRQPAPAAADHGRRAGRPPGVSRSVHRDPRRAAARHAGADGVERFGHAPRASMPWPARRSPTPSSGSPIVLNEADKGLLQRGAYVVTDAATEVPPDTALGRLCARFGVGSLLRVPLPLGTHIFGSLFFIVARREPVQRRRHGLRRAGGRPPGAGAVAQGARRRRRGATRRRGRPRRGWRRRWPRSAASSRRAAACGGWSGGRAAGRTCWRRPRVSRRPRPRCC